MNTFVMETITPEVLIAAITATSAITVAYISRQSEKRQRKKADKAKHQVLIAKEEIDKAKQEVEEVKKVFSKFVLMWGHAVGDIDQLLNETEVDRFLILQAVNGLDKPKTTTAMYQIREHGQRVVQYIDISLDCYYQDMLAEMRKNGSVYLVVDDMPKDALLRKIYESEGVKASLVLLISIDEITHHKISITYASFATHIEGGLTASTRTKCILAKDRLAGVEKKINAIQ